jgi:hypothetical protein
MNTPDNWVILKIEDTSYGTYYKVLAGWSGGYLTGDSWRMNSGIAKVEEEGKYYNFIGLSGSVYHCHKEGEALRGNIAPILSQLLKRDNVTLVDFKDIYDEFKNS